MLTAGISEDKNAYGTDLFTEAEPGRTIPPEHMQCVKAFHEQVEGLRELDFGIVPPSFRRYLKTTNAASTDAQIRAARRGLSALPAGMDAAN